MKNALTFIYGLILICIAIGFLMDRELNSFWDYVVYLIGIVVGISGFNKLDKATL